MIGAVGFYIFTHKDLPTKFPKEIQSIINLQLENPEETRVGTCFLLPHQSYIDFQDCGITRDKNKKTILIWGDSHTSQLIPGYFETFGHEYNIIQKTSSGCPPILNFSSDKLDRCNQINNYVISLINDDSPDAVVLAANWVFYNWYKLSNTTEKLKKLNVSNIDLIGTVPQWLDSLPKQLHHFYMQNAEAEIPKRMSFSLNQNFIQLEPDLRSFALKYKIKYLSPKDILCDPNGCMTMLSNSPDSIIAWDYAHLTSAGSRYLVSKFRK